MTERLSDYTGSVLPGHVNVCGVTLKVKEFDMRTRALWLDVAERYDLSNMQAYIQSEVIPKISGLGASIQSDPRIKSVEDRMKRLSEQHAKLMESYATDDEPEDADERIERIVARQEALQGELDAIVQRVQAEVGVEAKEAEKKVTELMETQDKARVYFVWMVAKALEKTEDEFEEFYARAGSEDYSAAERLIEEGNAPWASLYVGRMQERSKRKQAAN